MTAATNVCEMAQLSQKLTPYTTYFLQGQWYYTASMPLTCGIFCIEIIQPIARSKNKHTVSRFDPISAIKASDEKMPIPMPFDEYDLKHSILAAADASLPL